MTRFVDAPLADITQLILIRRSTACPTVGAAPERKDNSHELVQ